MSNTSTHNIWDGMVQRCHNPTAKDFPRYGAKGIAVCDRWRVFENFLADMGIRPAGLSIDRYPNSGGNYEPGNCRWATATEQVRNSTAVRRITVGGRTQCLVDWLREIGLSSTAFQGRVARGWSVERAVTTPPDQRFNWQKDAR
jgi:hypothetical protein